jgi:hypothetical protein
MSHGIRVGLHRPAVHRGPIAVVEAVGGQPDLQRRRLGEGVRGQALERVEQQAIGAIVVAQQMLYGRHVNCQLGAKGGRLGSPHELSKRIAAFTQPTDRGKRRGVLD